MADYSAMPSRLYKLYHDKVRDMPSLRTDDIKGAQPRKHNYAKGDILDKYNIAKNQAPASQEPKNFVYWQPPEVNREEYQSKSYGSYATAPYTTNSPQKQNGYALPQDYRVPGLNQNILNNPQYQDKYASINQMRNPMFANYDYARQQGQNGQNRNNAQQYQNGQYQDSLDNLSNRYGVQTQSTPNLHNPRTSAPSLNQPIAHLQSHPTFEKNLHLFFGIDHKKQPSNPQPNFQANQGPRVSAPYQANPGVRTGATPQGSQVAHLQSHPTFEKNLHMFFGVDHKKQPSNPQPNFQANQGPRVSAPYHTNPGVRTGATPQSSQVAHLQSHPTFEKNLHMFFGVDNKASNNQSNSQNRMAPTINAPLQNNQVNHLKGHPQFEKHLHAFFGVEKSEAKLVSKTQPNLQNYPLNYVGRNPLTHNATLNHQRIF